MQGSPDGGVGEGGAVPHESSTDAEEAGRRATADANHRGGGEGGTADLHAGAADGDAPVRRGARATAGA